MNSPTHVSFPQVEPRKTTKTFKVLCVNDMAINKWFVTVDAQTADEAVSHLKGKWYGVYPQVAVEAVAS